MSLILRYVNVGSTCVSVEESFLGFLSVDDTTGQGLFDVTRDELKSLDLDIDDVRGQGESKSLATNEVGDFEFLVSAVIWYDILYVINLVSKKLQSDDMLIDTAVKEVEKLIAFFEEFRDTGFDKAINVAKEIAIEMDIDPVFRQKRVIRRKRQFDENFVDEETTYSVEEAFKFFAKHNLAFRGTNEKLHVNSNGNFLGLIEMLEEFDPFIKEHVRRITSNEIHVHFLGHSIQNELIQLLARGIRYQIIQKIKQAKYFYVILNCTPDTSHQEQMSLILRYVKVSSPCVSVEESFLGFLNVDDTTRQGLFDVTHNELKSLDLDIDDVRGQGESTSLAINELGDFEFIVATVIWFDILSAVNLVSKKLQSDEMLIDVAIKEVEGLISFFEEFRDTGFDKAINVTKDIAVEMDIDLICCQKRVIRKKRQSDENSINQDASFSVEAAFKVQYFLYIVDQALVSLRSRFEQYKEYQKVFGFLFISRKLNSFDDTTLKSHCSRLEAALRNGEQSDVMQWIFICEKKNY
nr:zinc finger MYM-type protein 1-like [Tanacetum cinerariifolium]